MVSSYKLYKSSKIFDHNRVCWVGLKYDNEPTWKTMVCYTGLILGRQQPAMLFFVDNGNKTHWTFNKAQAIKDAEVKFHQIVKSL
tara:strand:+ start:149 stop:403 length:255 start_codon:yes stop_codon:yes gene_type:complete